MPLAFSEFEETHKQSDALSKNDAAAEAKKGCSITKPTPESAASETHLSQQVNKAHQETHPRYLNHIHIPDDLEEEDSVVETTALRQSPEEPKSSLNNATDSDNYLTVSGTIKRGKRKGQSVEVILNMSREELEILEANVGRKRGCPCGLVSLDSGAHVLLWTVLCFPVSMLASGVYSFCMGTITWYNVFKYFSENEGLLYRVLFPPILVIAYPFLIITLSVGLGLYAGAKQLSCCWYSWQKEFMDFEKGFYGWVCNWLDVPECSPYEVVILSAVEKQCSASE